MLRLLIAVFFIFLASVVWRVLRLLAGSAPAPRPESSKVRMVKCAVCDLYLPEAEAEIHDGRTYCSPAHRLAGSGGDRK